MVRAEPSSRVDALAKINAREIHQGLAELQAIIDDGPPLVANDQRSSEFSRLVNKHPLLVCLSAGVIGGIIILIFVAIGVILAKRGAPTTPVAAHVVGPPVAMGTKSVPNITTHPLQDRSLARASLQKEIKPVPLDVGPREGRALSIPIVASQPVGPPKALDPTRLFTDFQQELARRDQIRHDDVVVEKRPDEPNAHLTHLRLPPISPPVVVRHAEHHRWHYYHGHHHGFASESPPEARQWCGYRNCPSNDAPASESYAY